MSSLQLSAELTHGLNSFAAQHGLTINTLLQGAFALLLGRLTGEHDVAFGTTRAVGRHSIPDAEGIIGLLINTIPVRVQGLREKTVAELLRELREQTLNGRPFEEAPLSRIQEWSEVASGSPLFETAVVFERHDMTTALRKEGGRWADREFEVLEETNYPLVVNAYGGAALLVKALYRRPWLDDAGASRLLGHLVVLLEAFIASPAARLSELGLLTAAERRQLLVEWNDTRAEYPAGACLHTLVEQQVERSPDTVALVFEDQEVSYGDLNRRANRLAHALMERGVGPETRVGLFLERSPEMVVALLAVLKAGGAFVPLDPDHPGERLSFLLRDADPALVLTQRHLRPRLPEHEMPTLCVESAAELAPWQPDVNPPTRISPLSAAYLLYTSGSTGRPAGVVVEHRSVVNHIHFFQETFPLGADDRVVMKYSLGFDPAVQELLGTLLAGARLVVAEHDRHADSAYLAALVRAQRITLLDVVPTILDALIDELSFRQADGLRRLFCGGDTLPLPLQQRVHAALPRVELVNVYGPTEATISSTYWICRRDDPPPAVPIGRPIANTQVFVLDRALNPVPVGVPGDLYVGGAGVARFYRNRTRLTAERFLPNPFGQPGERLYRTGDVARWRLDGNLEFLGRSDDQVALRGLRVEPREIEAALREHPAVAQAVVVLREDRPGDKRLVGYCVPSSRAAWEVAALTRHLRARLPDSLVPTALVPLHAFPLTPSGKINPRALPAPENTCPAPELGYVAPRNPTEEDLAKLWGELLGVERVGIHDNFFALGGHSMLAARLFHQVDARFGRRLALSTLFQGATVKDLAAVLQTNNAPGSEERVVPLQSGGTRRPLFLLHSEGGDLLFWRDLVRHLGPDQPCFGIQRGRRNGAPEAFAGLADRAAGYVTAMRRSQPEGPYAMAGYSLGGVLALEMARQLVARGQHVAFLGIVDSWGKDYPRRLPLLPRIGDHVKHLWTLPRAEKLVYTRTRTRAMVGSLRRRSQRLVAGDSPSHAASTFNRSRHDLLPYRGRVVLFRAEEQPRWVGNRFDDPAMGWGQIATEGVDVHTVPGAHLTVFDAAHVKVLADTLSACLRATERAPTDPSSERVRGRQVAPHQERHRHLCGGSRPTSSF